MTVTSGPGFPPMMEHIGFAAMTETPCVFVEVSVPRGTDELNLMAFDRGWEYGVEMYHHAS